MKTFYLIIFELIFERPRLLLFMVLFFLWGHLRTHGLISQVQADDQEELATSSCPHSPPTGITKKDLASINEIETELMKKYSESAHNQNEKILDTNKRLLYQKISQVVLKDVIKQLSKEHPNLSASLIDFNDQKILSPEEVFQTEMSLFSFWSKANIHLEGKDVEQTLRTSLKSIVNEYETTDEEKDIIADVKSDIQKAKIKKQKQQQLYLQTKLSYMEANLEYYALKRKTLNSLLQRFTGYHSLFKTKLSEQQQSKKKPIPKKIVRKPSKVPTMAQMGLQRSQYLQLKSRAEQQATQQVASSTDHFIQQDEEQKASSVQDSPSSSQVLSEVRLPIITPILTPITPATDTSVMRTGLIRHATNHCYVHSTLKMLALSGMFDENLLSYIDDKAGQPINIASSKVWAKRKELARDMIELFNLIRNGQDTTDIRNEALRLRKKIYAALIHKDLYDDPKAIWKGGDDGFLQMDAGEFIQKLFSLFPFPPHRSLSYETVKIRTATSTTVEDKGQQTTLQFQKEPTPTLSPIQRDVAPIFNLFFDRKGYGLQDSFDYYEEQNVEVRPEKADLTPEEFRKVGTKNMAHKKTSRYFMSQDESTGEPVPPPYILVTLHRFPSLGAKDSTNVHIPPIIYKTFYDKSGQAYRVGFQLRGTINHSGRTMKTGHYTYHDVLKVPAGGNTVDIIRHNDATVTEGVMSLSSQEAYLLLYQFHNMKKIK
jgi:hypothetical protein